MIGTTQWASLVNQAHPGTSGIVCLRRRWLQVRLCEALVQKVGLALKEAVKGGPQEGGRQFHGSRSHGGGRGCCSGRAGPQPSRASQRIQDKVKKLREKVKLGLGDTEERREVCAQSHGSKRAGAGQPPFTDVEARLRVKQRRSTRWRWALGTGHTEGQARRQHGCRGLSVMWCRTHHARRAECFQGASSHSSTLQALSHQILTAAPRGAVDAHRTGDCWWLLVFLLCLVPPPQQLKCRCFVCHFTECPVLL